MISVIRNTLREPRPEEDSEMLPALVVAECRSCEKRVEINILKEMEARYGKPVCPFCFQNPNGGRK